MKSDAVIAVRCPQAQIRGHGLVFEDAIDFARASAFMDERIRWPFEKLAVIGDTAAPDVEQLLGLAAAHYQRLEIDTTTLMHRAVTWGHYYLATLKRAPQWATRARARPLAGLPVFVVAAGPSLDRNGELLAQAHSRGPVFAVNTSLSACRYNGVEPDVVVCVESKDLSGMLRDALGLCVLDATAHPNNWAACRNPIGIYSHEPSLIPYGLELGARPLNYGGSVACAAVALALYWGASQVVLVGQDLAFTGGRMYAAGTPFADVTVSCEAGVLSFGGESKKLGPQTAVMRPAWGGAGTVPSSHAMDSFVEWFEKTAQRHTLINATEGGARIAGTIEVPLSTVIAGMPKRFATYGPNLRAAIEPVDAGGYERVRARLRSEAEAFLASDGSFCAMPMLNMWGVPAVIEAKARGLGFFEGRALVRESMREGARTILEAVA